MAGEAELADLFMTLRAVNAPLLEGFTQVSAAGEEMATTLNTVLAEVDASIARTAESLAALRNSMAEVSAGGAGIGAEAGAGAAVAASGSEVAGAGAGVAAAASADSGFATQGAAATEAAAQVQAATGVMTSSEAAVSTAVTETAGVYVDANGRMRDALGRFVTGVQGSTDAVLASMQQQIAGFDAQKAAWKADVDAGIAANAEMAKSFEAMDAQAAAAAGANAKVGSSMNDTSTRVGTASTSLLKVGAAGAIAAGAVVDMAAKFQSSTTRLVTSGGELQSNLQGDQQGILALAGQVGYSADDLSTAMYKITSAGQKGGQALDTLKASAQGAKTENADLTTVADAVSTAMLDYKGKIGSAADVTSKLVAATSQGKTTFQDLAGAMSSVLPKASAAHINFDEILGDLASMTQHGMSAQQAAQNLADAISHMQNPTAVMSKEMASLGLNSTELSQNLGKKGLSGTISEISAAIQKDMGGDATKVILNMQDALKGLPAAVIQVSQGVINGTSSWTDWNAATKGLTVTQKAQAQSFATLYNGMHTIGTEQMSGSQVMQTYAGAMAKATGDSASLNTALMIGGQNADNTHRAISTISKASADASGNVEGWSAIQGTFNQKLSEAKDGLGAAAIAVGQKLLPPVTAIVGKLASFAQWLATNKVAASAFAIVIGVLLAGGLIGVVGKMAQFGISMAGNIIKPITGSIGLVRNFAGGLKGAEGAAATFGGKLGIAAKAIGGWASSAAGAISTGAQWAGKMIAQGASVAAGAIKSAAQASGAWIAQTAKMVATNASQAASWAAGLARQYAATAASAVKQAAAASAAWLASTAKMIGQGIAQAASWVAGMVVKFTAVAVSAVTEAAATAAAWIAANAAMIIATGGIILLLGLVVTAAIYLATHWSQVWNGIKEAATAVWHWIDSNIVQPLVNVWNTYIVPALMIFQKVWGDVWNGIKSAISAVWNFVKPIFDAIGNAIHAVIGAIGNVVNTVKSIGSGIGHLLGFDEGGWVPGSAGQPRLAIVHGGEYVLSHDMLAGRVAPDVPLSNERGTGSGVAPMFGSSGPAVTVVHMPINVGGSVVTDTNLTSALQKAFLQLSSRNVGFGTNVAFS